MANLEVIDRKPLTPEQEDQAWSFYEITGNFAEVARRMKVSYYSVRTALMRDPLRLESIKSIRAEEVAARWEVPEKMAARVVTKSIAALEDLFDHIAECEQKNCDTNMLNTNGLKLLSPLQAKQWMLQVRVMDMCQKVGFVGAKIAEGMRLMNSKMTERMSDETDASTMSDDDMRRMITELRGAGLSLPWGLEEWEKKHPKVSRQEV